MRDNRALEARPDVATFTGPELDTDLEVVGRPVVELAHSSDNPHADVFVRICDVDAEGRSRNVSDGFVRLGPPDPVGQVVRVNLDAMAHRFAAGHRIRLLVAGGAHPASRATSARVSPRRAAPRCAHRTGRSVWTGGRGCCSRWRRADSSSFTRWGIRCETSSHTSRHSGAILDFRRPHPASLPICDRTRSGTEIKTTAYAYIVVGVGQQDVSSANRLSEDLSAEVLLIEAGPANRGGKSPCRPAGYSAVRRVGRRRRHGLQLCGSTAVPDGSVRLAGPDITTPPLIDPNYLADRHDVDRLLSGIGLARDIGNHGSAKPWNGGEVFPGADRKDRSSLTEYLRAGVLLVLSPRRYLPHGQRFPCSRRSVAPRPGCRGAPDSRRFGDALDRLR